MSVLIGVQADGNEIAKITLSGIHPLYSQVFLEVLTFMVLKPITLHYVDLFILNIYIYLHITVCLYAKTTSEILLHLSWYTK